MTEEGLDTKYFGHFSNTSVPGLCRLDPNTGIGDPTPAYTYCLNLAEVEVETATGKTRVIRFTCVDDVGKVGNIDAVNGQAYGGISHSIGFALSEDYRDVKRHSNIASCGVPYATDTPDEINVIHYERPDEVGPFGSSGASEAFQSSGHVAVLNAIYNACGVRVYEMPATPAKVKAGIDALASGEKPYKPSKYFLGSELYEELENIKANPVRTDTSEDYFVSLGGSVTEKFF
jgi:aldehyde oxidoreductase